MATIASMMNLAVNTSNAAEVASTQQVDYAAALGAIKGHFEEMEDSQLAAEMKKAGLKTVGKKGSELKGSALVPSLRAQLEKLDEEGIEKVAKALGIPMLTMKLSEQIEAGTADPVEAITAMGGNPKEVEALLQEVEAEQTVELPALSAEPTSGNPEKTEEQALAEVAANKPAPEPEFPRDLTVSWGTATLLSNSSARVSLGKETVVLSEADLEDKLQKATKEQVAEAMRLVREKGWLTSKAGPVTGLIKGIFQGLKGPALSELRNSAALAERTFEAAVKSGDKEVAQKMVLGLLNIAKVEVNGRQIIAPDTINRIANEWGVTPVAAKKPVSAPALTKNQETQKPSGNTPAPAVVTQPASEPVQAPVEAQKELPVSNTQTQPPVVESTPVVEAPVAPVTPVIEEKKEGQPAVEANKPSNLLGSWSALLALPEGGRKWAVDAFAGDFFMKLPSKLETHKKNLVRAIRSKAVNGSSFEELKQAFKNANPGLKAWCVERFEAVKAVLGQMIVSALDKGATFVVPVQDSPAPVSSNEPATEPVKEEKPVSNPKPQSKAEARRVLRAHNAANKNQEVAPEPVGPVVEAVLEGTVEGEPKVEASKVAKTPAELKAEKKAAKEAEKAAKKANETPKARVINRVKVALTAADTVVRRFCAPLVPGDKKSVERLLAELTAACGEANTLVNPTSTADTVATLRNVMLQSVAMKETAAEKFWTAAKAAQANITDDRLAAMRNKATADWSAYQSAYMADDIENGLNAFFAGDEGLAKKQAMHSAFQYYLGRNETVQKEGRFVTEAGAKAIAEKAKSFKATIEMLEAKTPEEKAKKALSLKGTAIFAAVKDDKSYVAMRRQLSNAKIVLERAIKADLKDEVMIAQLQSRVDGLQKIGDAVDSVLRGKSGLSGWDLQFTGTTASRDMDILVEAILDTKFASTVKDEAGKDVVRLDGIAGSAEELRGTIGKLAAALLVKVVYEDVNLGLEVREIMEAIKSPKLLQQAAAKPGFRGYARTVTWAIYAGGVYVTLKTAAVLNWAAAPVKASYYALKAVGLYGFGFIAEDKEGNKKAVSEALATAKDLIIGFVVVPKDLIVSTAKSCWATVSGWFGGEKKADAVVADADKAKTPDQGKKEGVMNTISEKSKSVITYASEHKLETAGVVAGGIGGGVIAGVVMGAGVLATAGSVVAGAAIVAGGIWAVKKLMGWFSGRKGEPVKADAKIGEKCGKADTKVAEAPKAGEPTLTANGCGAVEAPVAAPVAAVASN